MNKLFRVSTVPEQLFVFCRGQLKMASKYFEVVAVSSPGDLLHKVGKRENVRVVGLHMRRHISPVDDFVSLIRLIFLFCKEKPLIVHSLTPKAGLLSMVAAKITGVPIRMHTYTGLIFPTANGLKQKLLIFTDRILCLCANYINPEGMGVKNDLIDYAITKKPLHIIANGNIRGIDFNYYYLSDSVLHASAKYKMSSVYTFCFVGRIVRDKGINELVASFSRLLKTYNNIRLLLVGRLEQELDPIYEKSLNFIKTNANVQMVGEQEDVRPFYAVSDALVFPSYREGFPNVVLEAGAMGLPAIVTNINGCNEIISDKVNGVIIPPKDNNALYNAMKFFVDNKDAVKVMGETAKKIVMQRYDYNIIQKELIGVYLKLSSDYANNKKIL